jgi:acyl-CoA hydrolase
MEDSHKLNNFVKDGSERSVQDIVSKLKFISKIEEGEIVDVRSSTIMEAGWSSSIYRTFFTRNESRKITLDFFRQTISNAFDMITLYLNAKDQFYRQIGVMIFEALQESKKGITNHGTTYRRDRMYMSQIETLLLTLDKELIEFNNIIKNREL